jgi:hypothetical protein
MNTKALSEKIRRKNGIIPQTAPTAQGDLPVAPVVPMVTVTDRPRGEAVVEKPKKQPTEYRQQVQADILRKKQQKSRLPDGACYTVTYDAASQTWSGTLTIPLPSARQFQGTARAVFHLLALLDGMYRDTVGQ